MNATTHQRRGVIAQLYRLKRWMYRGGRPGLLARAMNRVSALQFSAGILSPARAVTLEVPGRRSGRLISFPVVVAAGTSKAIPASRILPHRPLDYPEQSVRIVEQKGGPTGTVFKLLRTTRTHPHGHTAVRQS